MGIRVHKAIGYGLTDVAFKGSPHYCSADPRLNPEAFSKVAAGDLDASAYRDWLLTQTLPQAAMEVADVESHCLGSGLSQRIVYDAENGLGSVLLVIPVAMYEEWRRYDCPIDYADEMERWYGRNNEARDHVLPLRMGLFPWDGWMDARTGKELFGFELDLYRNLCWRLDRGLVEEAARDHLLSVINLQAQKLGFTDLQDASRNLVPVIPPSVRFLCRYAGLFTDETTINQLRPLLYVWWS